MIIVVDTLLNILFHHQLWLLAIIIILVLVRDIKAVMVLAKTKIGTNKTPEVMLMEVDNKETTMAKAMIPQTTVVVVAEVVMIETVAVATM